MHGASRRVRMARSPAGFGRVNQHQGTPIPVSNATKVSLLRIICNCISPGIDRNGGKVLPLPRTCRRESSVIRANVCSPHQGVAQCAELDLPSPPTVLAVVALAVLGEPAELLDWRGTVRPHAAGVAAVAAPGGQFLERQIEDAAAHRRPSSSRRPP